MVSNTHCDSLVIKLEMTEIGAYFDELLSAHDLGMPKEDIAIWSKIQVVIAYDPQRTLLIDDNLRTLQAAKDYGIAYPLCATFLSSKLDKIDPKRFTSVESYSEIMPKES